MSNPQPPVNNMLTFTPGTIAQSAQVNQDVQDIINLAGNTVGSSLQQVLSVGFNGFVQSGGIITTASGLTVNMSAAYIVSSGILYYMPAQSFTVGASKDTYIDFNPGNITYVATPVTNNTASPGLSSANAIRMGIVVSGASTITTNNQGAQNASAPTVSSNILAVCDSNGVLIYPTSAQPDIIGYRQITSDFNTAGTGVDITGLNLTVIIPTGKRIRISGFISTPSSSVANNACGMTILDVTAGTTIAHGIAIGNASGDMGYSAPSKVDTPAAGSRNYKAQIGHGANAATTHTNSTAAEPSYIMVEVIQ